MVGYYFDIVKTFSFIVPHYASYSQYTIKYTLYKILSFPQKQQLTQNPRTIFLSTHLLSYNISNK